MAPPAAAPPVQATPPQQSPLAWLWTTTMHPASKRKRERSQIKPPASSSQTAREKRRSDKKRQRLLRKAGTRDRVARAFQTEGIPQHVLLLLDIDSVEAFVVFLGGLGVGATAQGHDAIAAQSRWIFRDEALWTRMLDTHFKTSLSVDQAASSWNSSNAGISGSTRCTTPSSRNHWMDNLLKVVDGGCASLIRFLAWSHKREWFDKHVDVIMGDDTFRPRLCEPDFCNVFTAAAANVLGIRKSGGKALAPGFDLTMMLDAQVQYRIHVIDTQMALESPWESLSRSFEDALNVMQREKHKNIAVVIPSSAPPDHQLQQDPSTTAPEIAITGLREIQRFAIQSDWNGQIGIVCYDKQQFLEFQVQQQKLLDAFGSVNG